MGFAEHFGLVILIHSTFYKNEIKAEKVIFDALSILTIETFIKSNIYL